MLPVMQESSARAVPLCVDLDGTLLAVDTFHEACVWLLRRRPLLLFLLPVWWMRGKAHAKRRVAESVRLTVDLLPVNAAFLEFLRAEHRAGRRLVLATASDRLIADRIAARFGMFADVIASDGTVNLKGERKAAELVRRFGAQGFDYAGNARADVSVWHAARHAIVVGAPAALLRSVRRVANVQHVFAGRPSRAWSLLRATRPHQLLKNILIFIPLLSSHQFTDPALVFRFMLAYVSFSCVTSAVYLLNDILDLEHDRAHPRKYLRGIAAGHLPLPLAFVAIAFLTMAGLAIASTFPPLFGAVIAAYIVGSTLYSAFLKQIAIVDVLLLCLLYTVRIVAGNAASGISYSLWLLMFSMFFFFSLACLKRTTELMLRSPEGGTLPGRGYRAEDAAILQTLGIASAMVSLLVLGLYVDSQRVTLLYRWPHLLWFECVLMLYWVSRIWFLGSRGQMHEDPIVFTMKDATSYAVGALIAVVAFLAA